MRVAILFLGIALLMCGCEQDSHVRTDRDNTAVNERDADGSTKTPFDQSNEQADIDLAAKIRAEVLKIEDLSVNGRNVKIITNEGKVVLRGPVNSAAERDAIAEVASDAAGQGNVTNQLEVEKE
jgi:osmotically-inducible protein OsmY